MSTEHLQTEQPILSYDEWKAELIRIAKEQVGCDVVKINDASAMDWYNDGFSPYATFRETFKSNG